jgi:hypothetical protein
VRRTPTLFLFLLLTSLSLQSSQTLKAQQPASRQRSPTELTASDLTQHNFRDRKRDGYVASAESEGGSIREAIDNRYKQRYQEWKNEFLSTEIGRTQWNIYAHNPHLVLTITVARGNSHGAGSGKYKWNEAGELIAATITLGTQIDKGFPSAVYYPVMNALEPFESNALLSGNVLAATKIAHELGHIMKISTTPEPLYHLQTRLVPVYNKIFLSNGYNVNDPRLVELAQQMGGNPVELWEDREYWGEANAMLYLRDRVANEKFHCKLFGKIRQAVEQYAKNYEERFAEIAKAQAIYSCSWK